jgi:hypothetical protein
MEENKRRRLVEEKRVDQAASLEVYESELILAENLKLEDDVQVFNLVMEKIRASLHKHRKEISKIVWKDLINDGCDETALQMIMKYYHDDFNVDDVQICPLECDCKDE